MTQNSMAVLRGLREQIRAGVALDWKSITPDLVIGATLAVAGFALCLALYFQLGPAVYDWSTWDFWFESDPRRVYDLGLDRKSIQHHSTSHHPLFSLFYFPPIFLMTEGLGLDGAAATGILLALVAALWLALAYMTLRLLGLKRIDSAVFTALMTTSAAAMFWFPVPETFSFGALTLMAVIAAAAMIEKRGGAPAWFFIAIAAFSMTMTTTNWLAGLSLLFVFLPWIVATRRAAESMILVLAAWTVQHTIFPEADTFLNIFRGSEVDYVFNEEALGILPKLIAFFFHGIVMPDISVAYGYRLTVQPKLPGEGDVHSLFAAALWAALLAAGLWGAVTRTKKNGLARSKAAIVLGLAIAGQFLITILFGIESFLYSAHFAPLLVLLAAFSALTPARLIATPLAAALALLLAINNYDRLQTANALITEQYEHQRAYTAAFERLTQPDALILCGTVALTASGEAGMVRDPPKTAAPHSVISAIDPDTCAYAFGAPLAPRSGWRLWYEDWSPEAIDIYAARGARYFATQYRYGIAREQALFDELDRRYLRLARTDGWVIFDLQSPPQARH